jgi:hypothetical protein
MCTSSELETLVETVNAELEAANWSRVVALTADLYTCAMAAGETLLAELVQDLHWIANDALVHPLDVARLVSP